MTNRLDSAPGTRTTGSWLSAPSRTCSPSRSSAGAA